MADAFILPALLVLLSAVLKSFITNRSGTMTVLGEIGLGLPVDLSFVVLSIAITSNQLIQSWIDMRSILIVGVLILVSFQLGAIYKPCREFVDDGKYLHSFVG